MAEDKKSAPKIYFQGVSAIREVPFAENLSKLILSGYVPDMIIWLQEHATADGWININIVPKQFATDQRTHVAYLNERLTKLDGSKV